MSAGRMLVICALTPSTVPPRGASASRQCRRPVNALRQRAPSRKMSRPSSGADTSSRTPRRRASVATADTASSTSARGSSDARSRACELRSVPAPRRSTWCARARPRPGRSRRPIAGDRSPRHSSPAGARRRTRARARPRRSSAPAPPAPGAGACDGLGFNGRRRNGQPLHRCVAQVRQASFVDLVDFMDQARHRRRDPPAAPRAAGACRQSPGRSRRGAPTEQAAR